MSSVEDLLRDGILGRVESIAAMRGDEVSIVVTAEPLDGAAHAPAADQKHKKSNLSSTYVENNTEVSVDDDEDHEDEEGADSCTSNDLEGITYFELQNSYLAVTAQLQFRYGVQSGDKVIVCGKGNAAAEIVALLACMHMRAPFVPIDASWAVGSRVQDIVTDAQPVAAIVVAADDTDEMVVALAAAGLYRCVYLTPSGELVQSFDTQNITAGSSACTDVDEYPLYILYTSGSTGKPKGVVGTHHGLVNRLAWQMKHYPFGRNEVVCRRTPLVFVDALAEIFSALVCLAPLWSPPAQRMRAEGIGGIASLAHAAGVSRITLLPSQLHQACTLYPDIGLTWGSLKLVIVSGEECSSGVVNMVKERLPAVTLLNLYGSTEVAGDVTYHVAHHGSAGTSAVDGNSIATSIIPQANERTVPIGRAIEGNYLFIVQRSTDHADTSTTINDQDDSTPNIQLLPDGEVGELMVVGMHVARGYHNNALSSSAKFAPNPLCHERFAQPADNFHLSSNIHIYVPSVARSYSQAFFTGDLAVRTSEDVFHWCGRVDRQVKVRGVRLELEDVERQICAALGVDQGVVVLALELQKSSDESAHTGKSLVLFVEETVLLRRQAVDATQHTALTVEQVKQHLTHNIPGTMVPALVLSVETFPRNTSGKIDRKALQSQVEAMYMQTEHTPIHSVKRNHSTSMNELSVEDITEHILSVFSQVLNIATIDTTTELDNASFFALGGDSVKMIELLWTLRQWSQQALMPTDLQLSVRELAARLYLTAQAGSSDESEGPSKKLRVSEQSNTASSNATAISTTDHDPRGYPRPVAGAPLSFPTTTPRFWAGRSNTGTYQHQHQDQQLSAMNHVEKDALQGRLSVQWSVPLVKCVDASPLLIIAPPATTTTTTATTNPTTTQLPHLSPPPHLVIIGSHGGDVVAVDGQNGAVVWTLQLGEHIEAAAVADATASRVYVSTFSGQDVDGFQSKRPVLRNASSDMPETSEAAELGCLWCIDALTGEILWHYATAGEIKGSALAVGACVFVGAYDGHLRQLRASDGTLINKYACGGSIYAAPVLSCDRKSIFVATTARTLTQFAYAGGEAPLTRFLPNIKTAAIFATPVVTPATGGTPEGGLLVATTDGCVAHYTAAAARGSQLKMDWSQELASKPIFSSPCVVSGTCGDGDGEGELCSLVASHDGHLRLFSVHTGTVQWGETHLNLAQFASPCLLFTSKGCWCVSATVAGDVIVYNVKSGQKVASVRLPGEIFSSPVCVGSCVFIGCRDDKLYCLQFEHC